MSTETKKMNTKKVVIISIAVLLVVAAAFAGLYFGFAPKGTEGSKSIDVQVVFADGTSKDFDISTDEEFLRGALEQEKLIAGEESEYGLFITEVDGVACDSSKNEWWCITKGGEMVATGVDTTPIADGDKFELTLSTY